MTDHRHYVLNENIERFESLLRSGRLDRGQTGVVNRLLAQARTDLAVLDASDGAAWSPSHDGSGMTGTGSSDGAAEEQVRLAADLCEPGYLDRVRR